MSIAGCGNTTLYLINCHKWHMLVKINRIQTRVEQGIIIEKIKFRQFWTTYCPRCDFRGSRLRSGDNTHWSAASSIFINYCFIVFIPLLRLSSFKTN